MIIRRTRRSTFLGLAALVASLIFTASHYVGAGQGTHDPVSQANLDMYLELQDLAAEHIGEVEIVAEDVDTKAARSANPGIRIGNNRVLTAGPGPVAIPAAAFTSIVDDINYVYDSNAVVTTLSELVCVKAPVSIPDGTIITELEIAFIDNSVMTDVAAVLLKVNTFTGAISTVAALSTTGFAASPAPLNLSTIVTTNGSYSSAADLLFLTTCFSNPSEGLLGARVFFI